MSEFFHMGGYAGYVWSSYGLALVVMIALLVSSWISWRRNENTLKALQVARTRRKDKRATQRPGKEAA
ncbi:heme exporter protein CcmD [Aestuariispira ectoiniformans]|uniref:heme exporter protein CcmD n=1 Tax=Aestuariispira ectoiniformans TaxID=2775080 RepID=UPI0021E45FC2|nr:heme exporter protein CcmD [Aestuariispira ectoiniformans]